MSALTPTTGGDNPNILPNKNDPKNDPEQALIPTSKKTKESAQASFANTSSSEPAPPDWGDKMIFWLSPRTPETSPNPSREGTPIDPSLVLSKSLVLLILSGAD